MLDQILKDIEEQGYSFQENVLSENELKKLGPLFDLHFEAARVGRAQGLSRLEEVRGDYIHWIDTLNSPSEIKKEMLLLTELKSKLNEKFYLGLKDFECHLAKYPAGSFYKKHLDRFETDSSRSVSFIFYLHESWDKSDGGELVLYNKKNEILKTIFPKPGSMIVFMSEEFPHEVKPCHKERRSLTGWMHTKILN